MISNEVRQKFLKFFEDRGHKIVPSSSLVPEGDISVLFTTAGMQQFKGYYLAPNNTLTDFGTKNVTTVQKCVRTGDIDEVGDDTHLSFFEMLGNFSFGGYGRKEAIEYAYEFITSELGLEISYVTFYKGSANVPRDEESQKIWLSLGLPEDKIREDGEDVFWGPTGNGGPCGPTTEIYCKNAKGEDVEIWNIVFNEYTCDGSREQLDKGQANLTKLETLGIDTGMGLERLMAIVQQKESVFDTDVFDDLIKAIAGEDKRFVTKDNKEYPSWFYDESQKSLRVIADHLRTSIFLISDGVIPSSTGAGYVLRKLIRRAVTKIRDLSIQTDLHHLASFVVEKYSKTYTNLVDKQSHIYKILMEENFKFSKNLENGFKKIDKLFENLKTSGGKFGFDAKFFFDLYQTDGFPFEIAMEEINKKLEKLGHSPINKDVHQHFEKMFREHQEKSQTSSAGMFKGGLANHNEQTVKLHTTHHLLLAALQKIVDPNIKQRGSNITDERLRMDFTFDRKLSDAEKQAVENLVNEYIKAGYAVIRHKMPLAEAEKLGAEMEFGAKYPENVSVYFIQDEKGNHISKEFCGGPHVENTSELGTFKIQKEEAVAQGIRRIKAVLS